MNEPWVEKYRPKRLNEVAGQTAAVKRLEGYVSDYKAGLATMPHLLFTGPPGTGKTTIAEALARELFGDSWEAYVLSLNASDERGIDVIRNRIKKFASSTTLGEHFNLIILDEADHLTNDAQAALRVPMEEFARTCRFVLCCNYPNKIIQPIIDRCVVFNFQPVTVEEMVPVLDVIAKKEGQAMEERVLTSIAKKANGSLRRAISSLQNGGTEEVQNRAAEVLAEVVKGDVREAEKKALLWIREGASSDVVFNSLFDTIDNANIAEERKRAILFRLGDYEYRIMSGCNFELQVRCFLRELDATRGK